MVEQEIIQKAKKDYPIGTVINSVIIGSQFTITTNSFVKSGCYIKNVNRNDNKTPCIYDFNAKTWAKVIFKPENLLKEIEIW